MKSDDWDLVGAQRGHFRAFYRWLKRYYAPLFARLPDRTNLQRLLQTYQHHCNELLADTSVLTDMDSYPIKPQAMNQPD